MNKKFFSILRLCGLLLLFAGVMLSMTAMTEPAGMNGKAKEDAPYLFVSDQGYAGEVTDYVVHDGLLYVHYESKSVVQVYDENGVYLHSYFFFRRNFGHSRLYVTTEGLFFEDQSGTVFSIEKGLVTGCFEDFSNKDQNETIRNSEIENRHGDIVRKGTNFYRGDTRIIARPWYFGLFNTTLGWTIAVIAVIVLYIAQMNLSRDEDAVSVNLLLCSRVTIPTSLKTGNLAEKVKEELLCWDGADYTVVQEKNILSMVPTEDGKSFKVLWPEVRCTVKPGESVEVICKPVVKNVLYLAVAIVTALGVAVSCLFGSRDLLGIVIPLLLGVLGYLIFWFGASNGADRIVNLLRKESEEK